MGSHGKWDHLDIAFMIMVTIKLRRFKCIKCVNKWDELYDVSIICTHEVFEI
jgi:hypothetical protein